MYTHDTPIAFGKHAGTPLGQIKDDYFQWLLDNSKKIDNEMYQYMTQVRGLSRGSGGSGNGSGGGFRPTEYDYYYVQILQALIVRYQGIEPIQAARTADRYVKTALAEKMAVQAQPAQPTASPPGWQDPGDGTPF